MQQPRKCGKTVIIAKEEGTDKITIIQVNILPEGVTIRPQVKTSGTHTITLKANGTVWSYGQNTYGELGNGNKDYSDDPVQAIFPERNNYSRSRLPEKTSHVHQTAKETYGHGAQITMENQEEAEMVKCQQKQMELAM